MTVISPKKLIEVALPLDAINTAAAREKSIRHGHPSTLHLWWARRPLAAARAVIFAQLVHDPEDLWRCQNPGKEPNQQVTGHWTKARCARERPRVPSATNKAGQSVVSWLAEGSDTGPRIARQQCVSCLPCPVCLSCLPRL
jgi:adenine-specific DNA methylase